MIIDLQQKKIKTKIVWNHFDLRFILNYNIYVQALCTGQWNYCYNKTKVRSDWSTSYLLFAHGWTLAKASTCWKQNVLNFKGLKFVFTAEFAKVPFQDNKKRFDNPHWDKKLLINNQQEDFFLTRILCKEWFVHGIACTYDNKFAALVTPLLPVSRFTVSVFLFWLQML